VMDIVMDVIYIVMDVYVMEACVVYIVMHV